MMMSSHLLLLNWFQKRSAQDILHAFIFTKINRDETEMAYNRQQPFEKLPAAKCKQCSGGPFKGVG